MNPLSVACPYCRAEAGDPCRNTMIPGHPEQPHYSRLEAAGIDWDTDQ